MTIMWLAAKSQAQVGNNLEGKGIRAPSYDQPPQPGQGKSNCQKLSTESLEIDTERLLTNTESANMEGNVQHWRTVFVNTQIIDAPIYLPQPV